MGVECKYFVGKQHNTISIFICGSKDKENSFRKNHGCKLRQVIEALPKETYLER